MELNAEQNINELDTQLNFAKFTKSNGVLLSAKCAQFCLEHIQYYEQKIKELTEEKKKSDRVFSDLYKEAETYLAQRECLRNQVKNLTEENERLTASIKILANNNADLEAELALTYDLLEDAKSDTVNKMYLMIKERCVKGGIYPAFVASTITQVAKEILEGEE